MRAYVKESVKLQLETPVKDQRHSYHNLAIALTEAARERLIERRRQIHGMLREIITQGEGDGSFKVENTTLAVAATETSRKYVLVWFRRDGALSMDDVTDGYAEIPLRIVAFDPSEPDP